MKLREAAIRLTLDDWVDATSQQFGAHIRRYPGMIYWYGRSIYFVIIFGYTAGVSVTARNSSMALPYFWPDPCRLSVAHLCKLDADIADARHEEIISILLAFQREVE